MTSERTSPRAYNGTVNEPTGLPSTSPACPTRITVDLEAVAANIAALRKLAPSSEFMAIVKANAYGHGREPVARAAHEAGVRWFGVARLGEALTLREEFDRAGIPREETQIFTWLAPPDADFAEALAADLTLSASSVEVLHRITEASARAGKPARVHLKVDVGMSRGGALPTAFPDLVAAAAEAETAGLIRAAGIWSHLPEADTATAGGGGVSEQVEAFNRAREVAAQAGLRPMWHHLAATAGTLWHPETRGNMVRVGIGMYGLSPNPDVASGVELGLRPALAFTSVLVLAKQLPAGARVSYGGTWQAERPHWVGLVPVGYADGIPRQASNSGPVTVWGEAGPFPSRVLGRVSMDQIVVSLGEGPSPAGQVGDSVSLIGPREAGPSADQWAAAAGTINYEIVTRLGSHIDRSYREGDR